MLLHKSLGQAPSSSSVYAPPTITNIYKETMKAAGKDIKAAGYWNVVKEVQGAGAGTATKGVTAAQMKVLKKEDESLTRERLKLMSVPELQQMCEKRGLQTKGHAHHSAMLPSTVPMSPTPRAHLAA